MNVEKIYLVQLKAVNLGFNRSELVLKNAMAYMDFIQITPADVWNMTASHI